MHLLIAGYWFDLTLSADGGTITSNCGCDEVESIILAHAVAGVDVTAPAYQQGIATALDAIANNT